MLDRQRELHRALSAWRASIRRGRVWLADALVTVVTCGVCGQTGHHLFSTPVRRLTRADLLRDTGSALSERPLEVEPADWSATLRCACGERAGTRTSAYRFHRRVDLGLDLVAEMLGDDRAPRLHASVPGTTTLSSYPGAVTLFDRWRDLAHESRARGLGVAEEAGVSLLLGTPERVGAEVASRAAAAPWAFMRAHPGAVRGWPSALEECRGAIERGEMTAALGVPRAALEAQLAAVAAQVGAHVVLDGWPRARLSRDGWTWRFDCAELLSSMLTSGAPLGPSAAALLDAVLDEMEASYRFLAALTARRPATRLDVLPSGFVAPRAAETGEAVAPRFALPASPPDVDDEPSLERWARFYCDPAASYVDGSRVCRCGAVAHLMWRPITEAQLAVLTTDAALRPVLAGRPDATAPGTSLRMALAVGCDRHERFLDRDELPVALHDPSALAIRLVEDASRLPLGGDARLLRDERGGAALLYRGDRAGACFVSEVLSARLRRLAGPTLLGACVATLVRLDTLVIAPAGFAHLEALVDPLLRSLGGAASPAVGVTQDLPIIGERKESCDVPSVVQRRRLDRGVPGCL